METDVPDDEDMPDGEELKKMMERYEPEWKHMCEHFAANYLTLEKHNVDHGQISRDEIYYRRRLAELVRFSLQS